MTAVASGDLVVAFAAANDVVAVKAGDPIGATQPRDHPRADDMPSRVTAPESVLDYRFRLKNTATR